MNRAVISGLALSCLVAGGCTCKSSVAELVFACVNDAECGTGFHCAGKICVADDAPPPEDAGVGTDGGGSDGGGSDGGCAGGAVELCDNGIDDNCNALIDCADPACLNASCGGNGRACVGTSCVCVPDGGEAQTPETLCQDGVDNDCNGLTDCAETACAGAACGTNGRKCAEKVCACGGNGGTAQAVESTCNDTFDNDCNGQADCADTGCTGKTCGLNGQKCVASACSCLGNGGTVETAESECSDGFDNDCDGLIDCADPTCVGKRCLTGENVCQANGTCACAVNTGTVDVSRGGRSSVIEFGAGPAVLFSNNSSAGGVFYSECQSGCTGASPQFSTPAQLEATTASPALRPGLSSTGSGLAAAWRTTAGSGGKLSYAECGSGCVNVGGWTLKSVGSTYNFTGAASGVAARGTVRAVVAQATSPDVGLYGECSSGCATASGTWNFVALPMLPGWGASVALSDSGGTVRRSVVFSSGSGLIFGECSAGCTGAASAWATVTLGAGVFPSLVMDSSELPRVFYLDSGPPGIVKLARCTQRPCSQLSNWTTTALLGNAGYVASGTTTDGRTWFTASGGSLPVLHAGLQSASGYTVAPLGVCTGSGITADSAAGWVGASDRFRLGYNEGAAMRYYHQQP